MTTIDTNILLRFLLDDIPDHSARTRELFHRASRGEVELFLPATVIGEASYVLTRLKNISRQRAADALLGITQVEGVTTENAPAIEAALSFWRQTEGVSFIDSYHLALTRHLGMDQIYSFDQQMDRYPGVERVEP